MEPNWPLTSVVYQIYPRSFQDTNDDGIGDLKGIIKRLPYLDSLGISALWLSPVYPSPQKDFGYDVSNYTDIDPIFGNLSDFDNLVKEAHNRGIRIMMDYVPNHTSSEHSWFKESESSRESLKRDWYIWAEPKPDGSPPNNWLSVFGGSAWEFDTHTNQYYLHTFDPDQPDLNWRNPQVVEAMLSVLRFWLDRGVDGFRVDVPYHMFKDEKLRDEPLNPNYIAGTHGEYDSTLHIYTAFLPEWLEMMQEFSNILKEFKNTFLVTETWATMEQLISVYSAVGWKFFAPFNFSLITLPWTAQAHKLYIDKYDELLGNLYLPIYVLGNHDKPRVVSRIGEKQARVAAMLQLTLRGLPFIYYGEEIGMENGDIPPEKIQDTFEKRSPGLGLGRDPQRTPMQWSSEINAGFSHHEPWLPVASNFSNKNVSLEEETNKSMLSLYKLLIKVRKHHPALNVGTYLPLPHPAENVFAFIRETEEEQILIILNFDSNSKQISLPYLNTKIICTTTLTRKEEESIDLKSYQLSGDEGLILQIK